VPVTRRSSGPQPERAIDMNPGAVVVCKFNSSSDRVEGPAVNVSCLQADDQWVVADLSQGVGQRIQPDPTLIIDCNDDAAFLAQS
jgi:hypothetical protein